MGQQQQRPPPVLQFRSAGSQDWSNPCVLLPGLHAAAAAGSGGGRDAAAAGARGLAEVHISQCCASTRILLLPPADGAAAARTGTAAAAAAAAAEQAQPRPLWLDLHCRQLQVCLWDDERQRLLSAGGSGSGSGGAPLGRELFSLSVDWLQLQMVRQLHQGAAAQAASPGGTLHPWQQQARLAWAARLAAGGLQVDSYLPSSEQPVLLTCLPKDSLESSGAAAGQGGPPLQLALEVHHCPPVVAGGEDGTAGLSFRNAWVHDLLIQLPAVAVGADDALLLFAVRASGLLGGGGGGEPSAELAEVLGLPPGGGASGEARPTALAALQQDLAAEAAGAAASRLYIERAVVEPGAACGCLLCRGVRLRAGALVRVAAQHVCQVTSLTPCLRLRPGLACSATAAGRAHHSRHSGRAGGCRHQPGPRHAQPHRRPQRAVQVRWGCGGGLPVPG